MRALGQVVKEAAGGGSPQQLFAGRTDPKAWKVRGLSCIIRTTLYFSALNTGGP